MSTTVRAKPKRAEPMAKARLLVVEDEADIQELLRYNLTREGYAVVCADRGEQALRVVQDHPPDLIVLDLMLPGIDGLEVCRTLKGDAATSQIPIVMLTAKGEEADVVIGLEMGADDYITKPFSPRVLVARLRAVMRRPAGGEEGGDEDGPIVVGDLTLHPARHEACVGDTPIDLTATEFRLLRLLTRRPGRVFTRQKIIDALHDGFAAVTDRSVDVHMVSLRRKLGESGRLIETVRGVGYRLREDY